MSERSELLAATDATIDDAVKYADPMVLRGLLYQLTGDESIAATRVETMTIRNAEIPMVANPADVELIQSKAAAFLKSYRDQGAPDIPYGPTERLRRSMNLALGVELPESEFELWLEQLALDPWARSLVWPEPPPAQDLSKFVVAVIGAGMGGLNAAVQMKHAGIPYFVIETTKSAAPGMKTVTRARASIPPAAPTPISTASISSIPTRSAHRART
jgi:4-hydroxyacetophenone monooxygenase